MVMNAIALESTYQRLSRQMEAGTEMDGGPGDPNQHCYAIISVLLIARITEGNCMGDQYLR